MHDDAADSAGVLKTHVGPGFPGVGRLINSVAHYVAIANHPGLTGSRPDDTRIGRGYGQSADGRGGLLVKNWSPTIATVRRFPNAAGSRPRVIGARISRDAGNRSNTISDLWADEAESHLVLVLVLGVRVLCARGYGTRQEYYPGKKELPAAAEHDGEPPRDFDFYWGPEVLGATAPDGGGHRFSADQQSAAYVTSLSFFTVEAY